MSIKRPVRSETEVGKKRCFSFIVLKLSRCITASDGTSLVPSHGTFDGSVAGMTSSGHGACCACKKLTSRCVQTITLLRLRNVNRAYTSEGGVAVVVVVVLGRWLVWRGMPPLHQSLPAFLEMRSVYLAVSPRQ